VLFTPVVSVAVYVVDAASGLLGVSVAIVLFTPYVAATGTPPEVLKINVDAFMVALSMALLNVELTVVEGVTPMAPVAGVVLITFGGAGAGLVINDQVKSAASPAPLVFFTPVVSVAMHVVDTARGLLGASVAVVLLTLYVAGTTAPAEVLKVKVDPLTVAPSIAPLNVALTPVAGFTPVVPLAGVVVITFRGDGPVLAVKTTSTQ
jgi:hypothetical protein